MSQKVQGEIHLPGMISPVDAMYPRQTYIAALLSLPANCATLAVLLQATTPGTAGLGESVGVGVLLRVGVWDGTGGRGSGEVGT